MALIDSLYGDISVCKCTIFAQDLLNLSKQILQEPDKKEQWEIFLCFQRQYLLKNSRVISDVRLEYRSGNLCSMLLNRVEESKRSGGELPTLLLDLIANLYLRDCGQKCSRSLEQVYRGYNFQSDSESRRVLAAFYSETDFMKLLVNFGHLSSLPEGPPLLRKATENIMLHFM